ncbi:MAG TPA: hypothetical protein VFR58_08090 [Flavisolibacter sp.]|nr:hypothetical protein [Flavisolibacter sp.]
MQELVDKMTEAGITAQQAMISLQTVSAWLNETYPVAGVLVDSWIKSESHRLA